MNTKKSILAAAVLTAVTLGAAGQAAASVYARSDLEISSLHIIVAPFGAGVASIGTYNFSSTNTASLNGDADIEVDNCTGTFGGGTTCGPAGSRLDPLVVNAPNSDLPLQGENTFTFHGPSADKEYANADGIVYTAGVIGDAAGTHTRNSAESELQTGTSASSSAEISSLTGFTFNFTLVAPGTMTVSFDAIQNMLAAIADPSGATHSSLATMDVVLSIRRNSGAAGLVEYTPDGNILEGCTATGIFTCTESLDPFTLNTNVSTATDGDSVAEVNAGSFAASFGIGGAGDYTLTLSEKKSTALSRTVPEPDVMALLGIGLLGMGFASSRKNKNRA